MPSPLALTFALANLLVLAVALAASRRELADRFPRSGRKRRALLLILLLAFGVRSLNPYRPVPRMDDTFFRDQAEGLVHHHLNVICALGEMGDCQRFGGFKSIGYPLILSLAYVLLGFSDVAARLIGVVGGTATVACVYLLMRQLDRDHDEALVAALVLALLPMHVRFASVTLAEVPSVLTECLAVLAAVVHVRTGRSALGWLAASSLALHVTVRVENPLAIVPMLVVYWWGREHVRTRPSPLPWLVALVLVVPHFADLGVTTYGDQPISTRMDPMSITANFHYVEYWFNGYFNPYLFTALALLGCIAMWCLPPPFARLVAAWWGVRLALHLLHTFGAFVPRYMLPLSVPFAMACGAGARGRSLAAGSVVAAVLLSGAAHLPFAYAPVFGLELPAGTRSLLYALHLAIPMGILMCAAWMARGRERAVLFATIAAGALLVPTLYPAVTVTDGAGRLMREAISLEGRTIEEWEHLVGRECYMVVIAPGHTRSAWGRRIVADSRGKSGESPRSVLNVDAELREDVASLLAKDHCVYLYEQVWEKGNEPSTSLMMHGSFRLETIEYLTAPMEFAGEMTVFKGLALYRVSSPREQ
jgi:hypothetical protein